MGLASTTRENSTIEVPSARSAASRSARSIKVRKSIAKIASPVIGIALLGLAWQAVIAIFDVPLFILPPPSKFIPSIGTNWSVLWPAALITGQEVLYGFALGAVISIPLAMALSAIRWLREALYPIIVFLQVIPKIAVAPLFIIWFGAGIESVVLLTFILCFFPILVNAMAGFSTIDPRQLYITQSMGASGWQTFRYVRLKSAFPYIFAGFRIAVTLAVSGAIVGQFVGSNAGLGYVLQAATGVLNTPLMFADLVLLSVLGLVANYVVVWLEWLLMPWRRGRKL